MSCYRAAAREKEAEGAKVETQEVVDTNFVSFHLHITTGKSNIQELLIVFSSQDYD